MRQIMLLLLFLIASSSSAFLASDGQQPSQNGRNRIARVVTGSQAELRRESNDLLEETMTRLNQAISFHPDIACLPELFANRPPEPVPGPITERLAP